MAEDYRQVRINKIEELRAIGVNPYPKRFDAGTPIGDILADFAEDTAPKQRAAGRVTAIRKMGKASFMHI
ncbi:lysine--tRNA ligase, partial [Planctomycetota bacterium]